ncbi:MAG TPA: hypothetical protein VE083_09195 [Terriglobales bacterium]|nr:hypothetical protein [Terriglobales bacterium]
MAKFPKCLFVVACLAASAAAQSRRLWVLKEPDAIVEYDPATFAPKHSVKVPEEVLKAARILQINQTGQMLFAPNTEDPSPDVGKNGERFWFWDGQSATMFGRGIMRIAGRAGSNQKVTESSPWPFLSAQGARLFWFTNQFNKLERDHVDLSVSTTFHAWRSDLAGRQKEDLASIDFPECRCPTGSCSETCQEARFWVPDGGVDNYFVLTRLIPGQTETKYLSSTLYEQSTGDAWAATDLKQPLQRVLDMAEHGSVIISAILDTGCCGWENQSNDQTLLLTYGRTVVLFDERAQYKNPDYDVSFFTENAKLSPQMASVAMTMDASAKSNAPIQLSEQGQANPPESQRIRKALLDLPAVEVVSAIDPSKRSAFLPHAVLVGWLNEKEILIVENHALVAYDIASGARRKSAIKMDDPAFAFVR